MNTPSAPFNATATRILLVDDSKTFQTIFSRSLAKSGHQLMVANSGAAALAILAQQPADFICSTFYLSDMEGIELCRRVRTLPAQTSKPFVLLTAVEDTAELSRALPSGVTDIFRKRDIAHLLAFIHRFAFALEKIDGSVLYVEDSPSQRLVIKTLLENYGLTVHDFSNAEQALTAYEQLDIDAILTDIVLDGHMSGIGLVNQIRRRTDHKGDVPVLALTAFDEMTRRMDLFNLGISDYIIKPVVSEELFIRLSNIIARRRLAERATAHRDELARARTAAEEASHAKSEFIANMSHEIRTPMNTIIGVAHLLQNDIAEPHQAAQLARISVAARHLLGLINDILDFSKIEAGKLELENIDFTLDHIARDAASLVQDRIEAKGLTLSFDFTPLPLLRGDGLRLGQIFLNLLGNAVKFTEKGSIVLRTQQVERNDGQLRIRCEVTDSGIGLSAEQASRLFQAFEQADSSTTRKYGGTGLGLAISRRLIELMDGCIGVISCLGQGSTFWFEVPLHCVAPLTADTTTNTPPAASCNEEIEASLRTRGGHLLLVEDSLFNQEIASELLAAVGLTIDLADDGQQALECIARTTYDLVLMDMQMPVMDGLTATRAIRARAAELPHLTTLPILAMTANAFENDRQACLAAGMNDHISKPVIPERLYATLLRWLPAAPSTPEKTGHQDKSA